MRVEVNAVGEPARPLEEPIRPDVSHLVTEDDEPVDNWFQERQQRLLRAADGGLLFLDEIAEMGADEQAMLLRAVEERRFLPVGSDKEVKSDFQLIAGTNRDLPSADSWVRIGLAGCQTAANCRRYRR